MTRTNLPVKVTGREQISRIWIATLMTMLALLVTCTAGARPPATERSGMDMDMESTDMGWMQQLKEIASHGLYAVERASDNSRHRLSKRLGSSKPQQIAASYTGYEARSRDHKAESIRRLPERFTSLPIVLIGDSGQHDAKTSADGASSFPERVLAIYIRDVDPGIDSPYDLQVNSVFDESSGTQVPMVRGEDSRAFAAHMQTLGLLPAESSERVAGSTIRDDQRGRVGR